jgi:streptogramin lyase
MQRLRSSALGAAALAILLAGCGGGGASAPVPGPAITPPAKGPTGSADARFVFSIPAPSAKPSGAKRGPRYISSATRSIVVSVTPAAGGSAVSATIDVGSSACAAGSGGAQTCTLTVAAPVGSDTFVVTLYDAAGGSGNVLSTGSMTQSVQAHVANVFPLTLGGTIATLSFAIENAYLPVVDGGTTSVNVVAKDAAGNQIVGDFTTPVTIGAASGLTVTGATTMNSSADTHVSVRYDGASKTALALTATSGSVSGSGSIVPASHVKYYTDPGAPANGDLFMMVPGPDGALYFGNLGPHAADGSVLSGTQPGAIGRLDPATGTVTDVAIAGLDPIGLLFVGNDLYFAEQNSSAVGRIANAGAGGFTASNYSHAVLHKSSPGVLPSARNGFDAPRSLAFAAGQVYVTTNFGNEIASFDPTAWTAAAGPTFSYVPMSTTTPNGRYGLRPFGITVGADGNLYISDAGYFKYGYVTKLVPGATSTAADVIDPVPGTNTGYDGSYPEPAGLRFITTGADGKLYLTWSGNGVPNPPTLTQYDGGSSFTALPLPGSLYTQPDAIKPGSGSTVVFNDLGIGAVGVYDTAARQFREYPMNGFAAGPIGEFPDDVVDLGDGTYWFTNQVPNLAGSPAPQIGHLVLAQGWTVFPESSALHIDGLGPTGAIMLGIGEAASSHDTFTVTSATPLLCTVTALQAYANDYEVTGVAPGSCTVSVTDQTNRTVTVPIQITQNTVTISGHRRLPR